MQSPTVRSFAGFRLRLALVAGITALAGLVLAGGCDREPESPGRATQAQGVTVKGSGSTFASPMYAMWFAEYPAPPDGAHFAYDPIGSAGGIKQAMKGEVDFGGTDGPMTAQQLDVFRSRFGCEILHLPMALGADVPIYNIPGTSAELNFTPDALAGIFLGKITKWNDPELTNPNPGVRLPNSDIIVIHRSDGSGTTYIWADYLSKISAEWKQKVGVGTSVDWPVGQAAEGNAGVSDQVKKTPNSIGYAELTFAIRNKLSYGKVKNGSGSFIKPDSGSVTAAAAGAAAHMPDDFRVSITDPPGPTAYPIASFTWMLVPQRIEDPAKLKAIKDFLGWALTSGQDMLEPLGYARLPREVVSMEQKAIAGIHP